MRLALSLILTSVVAASATNFAYSQAAVKTTQATSGQPLQISVIGGGERRVKVRSWIKDRNGTKTPLPSVDGVTNEPRSTIEGPILPPDAGGGTIIVEVVDAETGERIGKGSSPISF